MDEEERRQFEVAALDRFKLRGKVYFEVTVEKAGDGGLIGLALQSPVASAATAELSVWGSGRRLCARRGHRHLRANELGHVPPQRQG